MLLLCCALAAALGPARSAAQEQGTIHACCDHVEEYLASHGSGMMERKGADLPVGGLHVTIFGAGKPDSHKAPSAHLVTTLKNWLLLAVVGAGLIYVGVALVQAVLGLLGRVLRRFPTIRDRAPLRKVISQLGPVLEVDSFEDDVSVPGLGPAFASKLRANLSKRETGRNLFLVTGEGAANPALTALQEVPQARLVAAAVLLLRGLPFKMRLVVTGSLTSIDDDGARAVVLVLRRGSRVTVTTEIRPTQRPSSAMSPSASNDVLAVAAAGWAEHVVADETPGPPGRDVFFSRDPLSWAFFRAGATLSRRSYLKEAGDAYERALAIDPANIGALVDLAHLRRREEHFAGAASLAQLAVELIVARRMPAAMVPDWYRARIVHATIYSEWAKREGEGPKRRTALRLSVETFRTAAETRDWIEQRLGPDALKKGRLNGHVPRLASRKAWLRARIRRCSRWTTGDAAFALHELFDTTFEPGALLLIADNCSRHRTAPPRTDPFLAQLEVSPEDRRQTQADLREEVCEKLKSDDDPDPAPLIKYVNALTERSPRVLYNLACHYGQAAQASDDSKAAETYTDFALEYLRQAVSRFPPGERRGVLEWVQKDGDLKSLRERHPLALYSLRTLIPT